MSIFNPWGEVRDLRHSIKVYDELLRGQSKQMEKLRFTIKENEREIKLLEKELRATRVALAEASKNDTRDTKGRFTKAKK
jgi:cell division protein FtsB